MKSSTRDKPEKSTSRTPKKNVPSVTPKKKTTQVPSEKKREPVRVPSPEEVRQLNNIKSLANLVKELLQRGSTTIIRSRTTKKDSGNLLVKSADQYIKALGAANCKLEIHHVLFREMYEKYRVHFLKCKNNESWMNNLPDTINIQLGVGTQFEKNKITLKISVACSNALKERQAIDAKEYDNVNDREEARGKYEYQYLPLFYFQILTVISDALEEEHSDQPILKKLIAYYHEQAGLAAESSSEEEGGAAERLSQAFGGTGKSKIDGKGIERAIEQVTGNKGMLQDITSTIEEFTQSSKKKGKKPGKEEQVDALTEMTKKIGPAFLDILDNVTGGNRDESSESGSNSGSEEDDSSE